MSAFELLSLTSDAFATTREARTKSCVVIPEDRSVSFSDEIKRLEETYSFEVAFAFSPHSVLGYVPERLAERVHTDTHLYVAHEGESLGSTYGRALTDSQFKKLQAAWGAFCEQPEDHIGFASTESDSSKRPHPLNNDVKVRDDESRLDLRYRLTSEYLIGKIALGIFLMESLGDQENWSNGPSNRQESVFQKIIIGLNWMYEKARAKDVHIEFWLDNDGYYESVPTVTCDCEPITMNSDDDGLWIRDAMTYAGHSSGDSESRMYSYVNDLRHDWATDWAGIIFVVDDWNDPDNMFADEDPIFAYADNWIERTTLGGYVLMHGGPYLVMTYDNDNWGHENMPDVFCHEFCHMFGCPDEYPNGGTCHDEGIPNPWSPDCHSNYGYLFNANHNCVACNSDTVPCIMQGLWLSAGLCGWSHAHLGWYDDDGDGAAKPIDPNSGKIAYVRGVMPGDVLDFFTGFGGEFIKRLTVTEANSAPWGGILDVIWDKTNLHGYVVAPGVFYLSRNGGEPTVVSGAAYGPFPIEFEQPYVDSLSLVFALETEWGAYTRLEIVDSTDERVLYPIRDELLSPEETKYIDLTVLPVDGTLTARYCGWLPDGSYSGWSETEFYFCNTTINADCDAWPDAIDNCPFVYQTNQLDSDGDAVGDTCDNCRYIFNPNQADNADCDTWPDSIDDCPLVYQTDQVDGDGDAVGDTCDNCRYMFNPNQADTNENGIGDMCEFLHVLVTTPPPNAVDVDPNADIQVTFNHDTYPSSVDSATFKAYGSLSGIHSGTVTFDAVNEIAKFDPVVPFSAGEMVTAILTDAIRTLPPILYLDNGFVWTFTIGAPRGCTVFEVDTTFQFDSAPCATCAADFDGDGHDEVCAVVGGYDYSQLVFLDNSGSGDLTVDMIYTIAGAARSIVAGDFDGDGDVDIVTGHMTHPGVWIHLNAGNGTFPTHDSCEIGSGVYSIASSDFDGDGDLDLAACDGSTVELLTNNGEAIFSCSFIWWSFFSAYNITVSDFDSDGLSDIAVAEEIGNVVEVLFNKGNGNFQSSFCCQTWNVWLPIAADFDSDHDADIATANMGNGVTTFVNDGIGDFAPGWSYAPSAFMRSLAAPDLDSDGDADLVMGYSTEQIQLAMNDGSGVFELASAIACNAVPRSLCFADLDHDGALDIVVGGLEGEVVVLLAARCVPGNANGYGDPAVDIDDLVYLINYVFGGGPAPIPLLCCGNANGSGDVDIDDIVYLINYVFSGGPAPIPVCE
jgi:hypothetical protein